MQVLTMLVRNGRSRSLCLASMVTISTLSSAHAETVQMFIVAGQSNASGRGSDDGLSDEFRLQPDVRYWYQTDRGLSRSRETRLRAFDVLKPLRGDFGPEIGMGHILADAIDDEVVIVKVAVGGTPLALTAGALDWNIDSTDEQYDKLISNVNEATAQLVAEGKRVELRGVFWMQGETDAVSSGGGQVVYPQPATADAYQENLSRLIQQTREDLDTAQLPFFVGQIKVGNGISYDSTIFGTYDFTPTVQAAQAAVAAADPRTYLIDTSDFALQNDHLHFNQSGQLDLGRAFANSYLATIPEPSTALLSGIVLGTLLFAVRFRVPSH